MNLRVKRVLNHLFALCSMCAGSTIVFATVTYMNGQDAPPKEAPKESNVDFQVEKQTPPKKKRERTTRARKEQQRTTTAQAPQAPDLSAQISGVSLDFASSSSISLGTASKDLIGKFDEQGPMAEGALDSPPKAVSKGGSQEYPPSAREAGVEGYVLLNIYVKGDGSVGGVRVLDASPRGVFEESAKDFVEEWSFQAGTYEGQSVDAWVKQKVVYKLQRS